MRVSSSLADHEELRVPEPPAADTVDTEVRCDDGALSILGMMIIERMRLRDRDDKRSK